MYTLPKGAAWYAGRILAHNADGSKFAGIFHGSVTAHPTAEGWLTSAYSVAYKAQREHAENEDLDAEKRKASRLCAVSLKVHKATLTKVIAKVAKLDGASHADVWKAAPDAWSAAQEALTQAGSMNAALRWVQYGGTPATPGSKPTVKKGPQSKAKAGGSKGPATPEWATDLVEAIRMRLDDVAAEDIGAKLAVHIERVASLRRQAEKAEAMKSKSKSKRAKQSA